uniref:Cyclic nucleotide-binding domain-containing protein n=1 Tax=Strigops habroptila TaxID=2489341 RepID=A0A672UIG8_STRHB
MEGQRLPGAVNPNHFPGKLWLLVNSPRCGSVRWDARGEGLLIDRQLFERELLGAGPAGDRAAVAADFFKTKNFPSFIRQLNLSAGALLHFQSPHFRRDRPDLLVRLKRLTSANKAKLAAGLEVPTRPHQRSRRLLGTALHRDPLLLSSTLGEAARPVSWGLMTVGQVHQLSGPDNFFPYSVRAASGQNPGAFLTEPFQQTPVASRTWQGSFGLLPGHRPSPAFPGQGAPFPILHKCSTEVTYTLQTVFSLLPLQRRAPTGAASLPQGSSCASPGQCSRAPDPTGMAKVLHLLLKKLLTSDTGNVFFQCLSPCETPHMDCREDKMMEELSLEAMLQILDKRLSPPNTEIVTLEPVESEISQPLLVNSGNSDSPSAVEGRQLAPLTPAAADTSFLMEAAQALTSAEGYDGELLFVPYDIASVERAAAAPAMAPEPVATQEAPEEWRKQLDHCPAQPPEMFVLEGLFSAEQVRAKGRVLPHAHGSGAGQEMVACKTHLEQQQRAPKSKQHRLVLEFF